MFFVVWVSLWSVGVYVCVCIVSGVRVVYVFCRVGVALVGGCVCVCLYCFWCTCGVCFLSCGCRSGRWVCMCVSVLFLVYVWCMFFVVWVSLWSVGVYVCVCIV